MRSLEAMSHAQIREPLQIRSSESLTAFVRVAVLGDCPTGAGPIKSHRNTFEPDQIRLVIRHLTALGGAGPTGCRADELSLFCLARRRPRVPSPRPPRRDQRVKSSMLSALSTRRLPASFPECHAA